MGLTNCAECIVKEEGQDDDDDDRQAPSYHVALHGDIDCVSSRSFRPFICIAYLGSFITEQHLFSSLVAADEVIALVDYKFSSKFNTWKCNETGKKIFITNQSKNNANLIVVNKYTLIVLFSKFILQAVPHGTRYI